MTLGFISVLLNEYCLGKVSSSLNSMQKVLHLNISSFFFHHQFHMKTQIYEIIFFCGFLSLILCMLQMTFSPSPLASLIVKIDIMFLTILNSIICFVCACCKYSSCTTVAPLFIFSFSVCITINLIENFNYTQLIVKP